MTSLAERTALAFEAGLSPLVIVLAVAALVVLLVLGVRSVVGLHRTRAITLLSLRCALAVAVVLLALRPVLRRERLSVNAPPVAVVVDASASMSVRDQAGTSRLQAVSRWTADHRRALDELEQRAVVDWFSASDGGVRSVSRADVEEGRIIAAGDTDLGATLKAVADRYAGRDRPALLLFSDGADHGALAQAQAAGQPMAPLLGAGGPIVAVTPAPGRLADLAVDLTAHDPIGFLRTDVTVRARVRCVGFPATEVPVSLMRGQEVVQVRTVRVGGDAGASAEVTFVLSPTQVGESLFSVQVPKLAGEAVTTNNEAAFSVRVVRDRIRVLQVVGRPSWDGRFLRELLKRDPSIDLVSFFILRSQWDDPMARVEELSLIPFPVSELFDEKLDGFDLVIFQNFDLAPYGIEPHLASVRHQVMDRGAGLLVIGGDLAFGSDYRGVDFSAVLPVRLGTWTQWNGGPVSVALTDAGARHPIMRVGQEEHEAASAVAALLPVTGVNVGLEPTAEAQVLLETADADHRPLAVAGEAGEGRVLVLATDGSWQWSLPMAGRKRSPRTYERFWENAIRWLVRDARSALVVLEADRRTVVPGGSTELRVRVRSEGYEPQPNVPVKITIRDAWGKTVREEEVSTGEDGVARLSFEPAQAGVFAVTASCARGEAGPLHVERVDAGRELADVAVRPDLLAALADATHGEVLAIDAALDDVPLGERREVRVESASIVPLWRSWPAWALVVGLACTEWWLRRRWGLA